MEAKVGADQTTSYAEFEPFCNWQREEARDLLVLHLPEFKKDQLKVQINNHGVLKISGERQVNAERKSKFSKEVIVPKNCITDNIHAKFVHGCLYITMPKKFTPSPQQHKPLSSTHPKPNQEKIQNQEKKPSSSSDEIEKSDDYSSYDDQKQRSGQKNKRYSNVVVNLVAIAVMVSALSAYFFYMYRSVLNED